MRILGFTERWDKLQRDKFTTFRFPRKDKDWEIGEVVRVVFKPRSKDRQILGMAKIVGRESRQMLYHHALLNVSSQEAVLDGFNDPEGMECWLVKTYGLQRLYNEPMNKLTLQWVEPIW